MTNCPVYVVLIFFKETPKRKDMMINSHTKPKCFFTGVDYLTGKLRLQIAADWSIQKTAAF